ncbi:MAG: VWA domain-containing protein [Chloroflexaceae bacterium]|nr:VWA domain-containing protein [Chloroflexaceae bacterium]
MPATQGASSADVADAISDVRPEGNTNVRAGLQAAEDMLAGVDANIKHVILLTDGWGEGGSNLDIAARMQEQGMTLSVVAAGSGSATYLENLAQTGGGRFYPATDMAEVPEIFLQETIVAAGNYIVERPFFPAIADESPILSGLDGLPILYGYNGTTLKDTAQSILVADDQSPVLAQWQYGLGRTIAWTSDTKGQWGSDLVTWDEFPRFAAQMVGWMLPSVSQEQIDATVRIEGSQIIIDATVEEREGATAEDLQLSASILGGNGQTGEESTQRNVTLHQVAPGEYRAVIQAPNPGSYLVQLHGQEGGQITVQSTMGMVVPYSSEYRQDQNNPALLAELASITGGSTLREPIEAFARNDLAAVSRAQEIALPLLILALLLLPLMVVGLRVARQPRPAVALAGLLLAFASLLILGCEYVMLPDHTLSRSNTIFKVYFQAWVLLAIAAPLLLAAVFRRMPAALDRVGAARGAAGCVPAYGKAALLLLLVAVLLSGSVYPILRGRQWLRYHGDRWWGLDGMAQLDAYHPHEAAAVRWLQQQPGTGGVLETIASSSDGTDQRLRPSHFSALTGRPTPRGWSGHTAQWHNYRTDPRMREEFEMIGALVLGFPKRQQINDVLVLMAVYQLDYVVFGALEAQHWGTAGQALLDRHLPVVWQSGPVTIYGRPDDFPDALIWLHPHDWGVLEYATDGTKRPFRWMLGASGKISLYSQQAGFARMTFEPISSSEPGQISLWQGQQRLLQWDVVPYQRSRMCCGCALRRGLPRWSCAPV